VLPEPAAEPGFESCVLTGRGVNTALRSALDSPVPRVEELERLRYGDVFDIGSVFIFGSFLNYFSMDSRKSGVYELDLSYPPTFGDIEITTKTTKRQKKHSKLANHLNKHPFTVEGLGPIGILHGLTTNGPQATSTIIGNLVAMQFTGFYGKITSNDQFVFSFSYIKLPSTYFEQPITVYVSRAHRTQYIGTFCIDPTNSRPFSICLPLITVEMGAELEVPGFLVQWLYQH
jgi:hypothetical protein